MQNCEPMKKNAMTMETKIDLIEKNLVLTSHHSPSSAFVESLDQRYMEDYGGYTNCTAARRHRI
jgi:hypothetical protein